MNKTEKYDVIIVGAGSMGMAAGYFLAKEGKNVLQEVHDIFVNYMGDAD